ncbi:MAG TPA: hypothetical protein VNK41_12160 [Vicinamibacterales bacterium]|nr:hypothetical protein [Vicinamibacterales bacterium]
MLDPLAEIRRLYFETTRETIDRDFERALDLLKTMGSEEERSRATVFMHGLAQMRSEWKRKNRKGGRRRHKKTNEA